MMFSYIKKSHLLLLLPLLFITGYCRAQQSDSLFYQPHKTYLWAGPDVGTGTLPLSIGGSAYVLLNNKFILGLKADASVNLLLNQDNEVDEFALMTGAKLTHNPYGNLILLTGISIVSVYRPDPSYQSSSYFSSDFGTGNRVNSTHIGLPIALKYLFSPTSRIGFDITASADINNNRNLFNVTIGSSFGWLRSGGRARRHR